VAELLAAADAVADRTLEKMAGRDKAVIIPFKAAMDGS
jgi:hypothetical protein